MKEIFFTAVFVSTLLSCGTDNTKESLSYTEIGASDVEKTKIEPKQIAQKDSLRVNFNSELFEQISGLITDSVAAITRNEVIDRVPHLNSEKVLLFIDSNAIQFKSWDFKDSSDLKMAWYNLLDCFGEHCESIELFDSLF